MFICCVTDIQEHFFITLCHCGNRIICKCNVYKRGQELMLVCWCAGQRFNSAHVSTCIALHFYNRLSVLQQRKNDNTAYLLHTFACAVWLSTYIMMFCFYTHRYVINLSGIMFVCCIPLTCQSDCMTVFLSSVLLKA